MDTVINFLREHWGHILVVTYAALNLFNGIAKMTKSEKDDSWAQKIRGWIDRIAVLTGRDAQGTLKVPGSKSKTD